MSLALAAYLRQRITDILQGASGVYGGEWKGTSETSKQKNKRRQKKERMGNVKRSELHTSMGDDFGTMEN